MLISRFLLQCWSNQMHFTHSSSINDICISKVTFEQTYIFLTMADNSIQVLLKDFKRVSVFDLNYIFKVLSLCNLKKNKNNMKHPKGRKGVVLCYEQISTDSDMLNNSRKILIVLPL